jgi:hypothetical protein
MYYYYITDFTLVSLYFNETAIKRSIIAIIAAKVNFRKLPDSSVKLKYGSLFDVATVIR